MGRGVWAKVLFYVPNLRLLGCFLLVDFGGVVLVLVLVLLFVVTGGQQSQLLVLGLGTGV